MRDLRGTWKEIAALVGVGLLAGTLSNMTAAPKRRLTWIGTLGTNAGAAGAAPALGAPPGPDAGPAAVGPAAAAAPAANPAEIDTARAWAELQSGAIFLDARPSSVYADEGHIPKARSLGVWEGDVDAKVIGLLAEGIRPDATLVVYCTGGHCEDSHHLREKLTAAGFVNVLVYRDGFPGWVAAGHPVEK